MKNVVMKTKTMAGTINWRYDMTYNNMLEIYSAYGKGFDAMCCAFRFGYMQGMKAAKAEQKRKERENGKD